MVGGRIFGAHGNVVRAGPEKPGDIELKRGIATLVPPGEPAVNPYHGAVIDSAKMQQHAAAFPSIRNRETTLVPDPRMKRGVSNAAARALKTERHRDAPGEAVSGRGPAILQPAIVVIKFELPGAVEVHPLLALELGLRVFRPVGGLRECREHRGNNDQPSTHEQILSEAPGIIWAAVRNVLACASTVRMTGSA